MAEDVVAYRKMVESAASGSRKQHGGPLEELRKHLCVKIHRHDGNTSLQSDRGRFTLDLSDIHLNGLTDEVPSVLIAGSSEEAALAVKDFCKHAGSKDAIPFIFCLSEEAYLAAKDTVSPQYILVLSPSNVVEILASKDARLAIKRQLWQEIPRHRLSPYNVLRPAEGNMFFGRHDELESLLWDRHSSFAVAGPSRIGKSSLLKRYKSELQRRRDPRRGRVFLIDFYDCSDGSSDSVARHIACRMGETWGFSRSAHHLPQVLKCRSQSMDGPIELLLDEVDSVCFSQAFNYLAEAARNGYVRLIICGRGNLLNTMHKKESHLAQRLKLLQPEPLEPDAARDLLALPLRDLGFEVPDEDGFLTHVLDTTGRLPGLLQYYGATLVDGAVQQRTETITMKLVSELEQRFETAERFLEPLLDLPNGDAAAMAILILRDHRVRYQPSDITRIAEGVLKTASPRRIMEVSNELLIQGVLAWEDGEYRIGNGGMRRFARHFGLLDKERVA